MRLNARSKLTSHKQTAAEICVHGSSFRSYLVQFNQALGPPRWSVKKLLHMRNSERVFTSDEITRLCQLSYLSPQPDLLKSLCDSINRTTQFLHAIHHVQTANVEPCISVLDHDAPSLFRRTDIANDAHDWTRPGTPSPSPVLANAAHSHSSFFVVPKVREDDTTN